MDINAELAILAARAMLDLAENHRRQDDDMCSCGQAFPCPEWQVAMWLPIGGEEEQ